VISADQAAFVIKSRSKSALKQLREDLAQDTAAAARLLGQLAEHPDPVVRDWAGWAAAKVLPRAAAITLLGLLAEDADADVRMEAQRFLVDLDRAWARRLVPRYIGAMRSDDSFEAVDAIWQLTQLREGTALPVIQDLATNGKHPAVRNNARIAALVLGGREEDLIAGLRAHDHVLCVLWSRGLGYLGTTAAINALRDYVRTGPDSECRARAAAVLAKADELRPISAH
jgi:HEAT repeat protein